MQGHTSTFICQFCGRVFSENNHGRRQRRYCSHSCAATANARHRVGTPWQDRFWANVDKSGECWMWAGATDRAGYGKLTVNHKLKRAHRLSYEIAHGLIPADQYVCHRCDTPGCVRPDHLFVGTPMDNVADCDRKGRTARGQRAGAAAHPERKAVGERIGTAKLTAQAVKEIREQYRAGVRQVDLARRYGVVQTTISRVVLGRYWKDVGYQPHSFQTASRSLSST